MENRVAKFDLEDNRATIESLRVGDEKCFDAIYRHYYRALCSYSSRFVAMNRAEEIVQDTMMWIWENHTALIPDMSLKSLLFTIVKNKSVNSILHNTTKNRVIHQLMKRYEAEFDVPELYLENELIDRFVEALSKMPLEFQQTFRMHRLEGMTHKQISEQLGVSLQTVNYRIGQTIKLLRKELKEYLPLIALLLNIKL